MGIRAGRQRRPTTKPRWGPTRKYRGLLGSVKLPHRFRWRGVLPQDRPKQSQASGVVGLYGAPATSEALGMRTRAWGLALLVWGCAGATPPPAEPSDDPSTAEPDPVHEPAREAPRDTRPAAIVGSDDYELSHRDCRALAVAYGRAWMNDELEKLAQRKLEAARHDEAAAEIQQGGAEMRDNWLGECEKTVGSPYRHESLACAVKAKTMKAFDDCWQGR
jgi:hypothetical protein